MASTLLASRAGVPSATFTLCRSPRHALLRPAVMRPVPGRRQLQVSSWAILKRLGLKKPSFLPDFGQEKRKALLDRFFGPVDSQVYEELLDPGFTLEGAEDRRSEWGDRKYWKADFIEMMRRVSAAVPDFCWSAATDGSVDADGFAIVTVSVTGHHTGAPYDVPGMPPLQPSGKRVSLQPEAMRVRVEDGKIKEIKVLAAPGQGPMALYDALRGELPPQAHPEVAFYTE